MVIIIKRTTDDKYLKSLTEDIWVDDIKQVYIIHFNEISEIRETLLKTYAEDQLKEFIDFVKVKPLSKEDKKEFRKLLKQ